MYDCVWMKCLRIRFTFIVFPFIKLPTFHPCTLYKPVGTVSFSFALEELSVSMLAHRIISRFLFLKKIILVQAFTYETQGFSFLCFRPHNSCVVNKFFMNNEKSLMQCNQSNHATKQNAQCICKGIGIAKDSNGLLRPNEFFIYWFKGRWEYKKEKGIPHNEHSKYSMPTGCRFYPERAL